MNHPLDWTTTVNSTSDPETQLINALLGMLDISGLTLAQKARAVEYVQRRVCDEKHDAHLAEMDKDDALRRGLGT